MLVYGIVVIPSDLGEPTLRLQLGILGLYIAIALMVLSTLQSCPRCKTQLAGRNPPVDMRRAARCPKCGVDFDEPDRNGPISDLEFIERRARWAVLVLAVGVVIVGRAIIESVQGNPIIAFVLAAMGAPAIGIGALMIGIGGLMLVRIKCPKCSRRLGGIRATLVGIVLDPPSATHACPCCGVSFDQPHSP
jgi:hypothetical protein